MSIFKHIAHPVFDEVPGQAKPKSYINPKTGKREYFLGALLSGAGTAVRLAMPAIRTAAQVGMRTAGTALRAGSKFAGQAAKVGSKYAAQGAKYAGQAAKVGSKYAVQGGKYVSKNALPAIKAAGTQIAKAAPDAMAGYAQYQQQKDMRNQQNRMLDIMAGMAQPQYQEAPQNQQYQDGPQQYEAAPTQEVPQYQQQQYQPQQQQQQQEYNPYVGQQMDYQNPMDFDPSRANYAIGGKAHTHRKHLSGKALNIKNSTPPPMFDPLALLDPASLIAELTKQGPMGEIQRKMEANSGQTKGIGIAGDMLTGHDGYTKKNAVRFFNQNPGATKQDFANHTEARKKFNQDSAMENINGTRQADVNPYGSTAENEQPQPQPMQPQQKQFVPGMGSYGLNNPAMQQQIAQPKQLVSDHVVHKRISGVLNRSPDIINRMQQEFQGFGQR